MDSVAEIICTKICKQLTQHMDYKHEQKCLEKTRPVRAQVHALEFSINTFDQMKNLEKLEPQHHSRTQLIQTDNVNKVQDPDFGRKISILKTRKNSNSSSNDISTMFMSTTKRTASKPKNELRVVGLVKLKAEETDDESYLEFIEKQRQRKIKMASVLEQFIEMKTKQNLRPIRPMRDSNNADRLIITSLSGEFLKCEKKEKKSKKDDLYLTKMRVKPLFRLHEQINSRGEVQKKEIRTETRRVSISKDVKDTEGSEEDKHYIKSIINVITTRQQLDSISKRKRRKNMRGV